MTRKLPHHVKKLNELQRTVERIQNTKKAKGSAVLAEVHNFTLDLMSREAEAEAKNWALGAAKRRKEREMEY
jgi:hypothetical protein